MQFKDCLAYLQKKKNGGVEVKSISQIWVTSLL